MRTGIILVLLIPLKHSAIAQHLSAGEVNRIGQSLVDQLLLTENGKAELLRFSEKKPLQVYEGFNESFLNQVDCPVYFLKSYKDILPGRGIFPTSYYDSLLKAKPDFEKECAIKEERYLAGNFPNRSDLFNFLITAADFYKDKISSTDSVKMLANRFGKYFGPAIQPLYKDSTIEFNVSYFDDTKGLQEERVNEVKPYLKWISLFKKANLLADEDHRMELKFTNGKEIYTAVSHLKMIKDIGELILYHDKFLYYKQQQLALLDSLKASGFIDQEAQQKLTQNYQRDTLLTINDLVRETKNYITFAEKEVSPFDFVTRDNYGLIPPDKIKGLYELVLKKAAVLLNFTYSDLKVHTKKDEAADQTDISYGNRQFYMEVKLNNTLYREEIKERDLESWISAQNFQFLNHFLEDQNDPRRLYFTNAEIFTGYESQDQKPLYLTLLKEKEAWFAKNIYLASKLNACYNGSPGDYNYAAWEYYDLTVRLTHAQITDAVDFFIAEQLMKVKDSKNRNGLIAAIREQNPASVSNILLELPNAFTSGKSHTIEGFLDFIESRIQLLQQNETDYFTDYNSIYKEGSDNNYTHISFKLNQKEYQFDTESEDMVWENKLLINTVNKALQETAMPYAVYPLPEDSKFFRQDLNGENYIVLSPAQAASIVKKYGNIF